MEKTGEIYRFLLFSRHSQIHAPEGDAPSLADELRETLLTF